MHQPETRLTVLNRPLYAQNKQPCTKIPASIVSPATFETDVEMHPKAQLHKSASIITKVENKDYQETGSRLCTLLWKTFVSFYIATFLSPRSL